MVIKKNLTALYKQGTSKDFQKVLKKIKKNTILEIIFKDYHYLKALENSFFDTKK